MQLLVDETAIDGLLGQNQDAAELLGCGECGVLLRLQVHLQRLDGRFAFVLALASVQLEFLHFRDLGNHPYMRGVILFFKQGCFVLNH